MTTFATDLVNAYPLYKDLETWEAGHPGSLFCAVFVCILSEIPRPGKGANLQPIDTKKKRVHPCNLFRNSNLFLHLSFLPGNPGHDSRRMGTGLRHIVGR